MKKHILRQKRSRRSQLAGLALLAVLAAFPGGRSFGETLNVGPGKPYSTLQDLRQHRQVWNDDVIVVFSEDHSLTGPLNVALQGAAGTASIRADGNENRTISYAGLKSSDSRVVVIERGTFHFGENLTFVDSKQTESGGIGYVSLNGTITVDGTIFTLNEAKHGGVFANEGATLRVENSVITANKASFGGGVYSNGGVTMLNSVMATENSAGMGGAVVHAAGTLNVFNSIFENNTAILEDDTESSGFGGAMAVTGGVAELKNTNFLGNSAAVKGGAVYVSGTSTLNIVAEQGTQSVWERNTDGNGDNSIFFDFVDEEETFQQLNVYGEGDVYMEGPIRAEKTVDNSGTLSIKKWGTGKWHLGGDNVFSGIAIDEEPAVTLKTTMEIQDGSLELGKDAAILIQSGSFHVKSGATLTTLGNNTITVNGTAGQTAVAMESGSRIEVNMTAMQAGDDNTVAMLTFDGRTFNEDRGRDVLDMTFGTITVDVTAVNAYKDDDNVYTLVFAEGVDFSGATLLIGGEKPTTDAENDRIGKRTLETISSGLSPNREKDMIILKLENVDVNREVSWGGTAENSIWSEKEANWHNSVGDPESPWFLNGDDVVFGADAGIVREVSVEENGVRFGTMTVQDDYSFSGGELFGDKIKFGKDAVLTFDSRTLNLSMAADPDVKAGLVAQDENLLVVTAKNGSAVTGQDSTFSVGREGSRGEIHFLGNRSSTDGGAFNVEAVEFLGGTTRVNDNSAGGDGGAVAARTVSVTGGTVEFRNNSATGLGGAVYAMESVHLHAGDGDIVFAGNTQNSGAANAIYMANIYNTSSNSLQLTTGEGRTIMFSDPIENEDSVRGAKTFTIEIGGAGTVHFDGYRSDIRGATTVNGGTVRLTQGAVYGAKSGNESFALKNGATLLVDSSGTGIAASSIRLDRDSTIRIDLADAAEGISLLTLDGSVALPETGGVNLDVLITSQNGTYRLLSGGTTDFQGKFIETINGVAIGEGIQNDRYGTREFTYEPGAVHLTLKNFDQNRTVNWSGRTDNVWSENAANWTITGSNKKYFLNGDSVVFSDNGLVNTIAVADGGVVVSDMRVSGGNYRFIDGDINGGSGTLLKSGLGTLTLNQRNVFGLVDVEAGILAGGNGFETIVGDLMVRYGAVLAPGNGGTDVFHVDGNIGFESGAYLYLDLGRTLEKSDQLIATGSIDFSNNQQGTVTIVVAGSAVPKGSSTTDEAVIQAGDGLLLNGTILSDGETAVRNEKVTIQRGGNRIVIQSDGSLDLESAVVSGDGKSMAINAVGAFDAPELDSAFSWNQLSVRESILDAPTSTFANQLMAKYALTDDDAKRAFLEQLLPTLNSAMPKVTQRAVYQYRQILFERLRNRNHEQPGEYLSRGEQEAFSSGNTVRGQRYCPDAAPITWFHNYGDFMHQNRRDVQGYDSYSYGLAIGTETWMNRDTVIGVGIGGAFASVNTDDRSQKADVNSFLFTPYISHVTSDGYKLMASIGYAYNDYEIRRHPGGTEIKSKHDGSVFLINAEVSKKLQGVWTDVTPFFGLDLIYLHEEKYREKSNGAVISTVNAKSTDSCLQTLGLRFGRTRMNGLGWLVNPTFSLGWIHDYGDGSVRTVSSYAGGAQYTIRGSSMNRDRVALGLNYCADFNERISFFTGYNAEFASRYDVHTIQLGCTLEF